MTKEIRVVVAGGVCEIERGLSPAFFFFKNIVLGTNLTGIGENEAEKVS